MSDTKKAAKPEFTPKEIAAMIVKKYPTAKPRLFYVDENFFLFYVYDLSPLVIEPQEAVIIQFFRSPDLPYEKSFHFWTRTPWFAIPI